MDTRQHTLSIVSFNMHGFNQGFPTIRDLCLSNDVDLLLLQEHWLTPANFSKLEQHFPNYFCFGSSAMAKCVESGLLTGRPYGGVAIVLKMNFKNFVVPYIHLTGVLL
jgi:exonuclease III